MYNNLIIIQLNGLTISYDFKCKALSYNCAYYAYLVTVTKGWVCLEKCGYWGGA